MSETYARVVDTKVREIIPPHPDGFPLDERFPGEIVAQCVIVPPNMLALVKPGWLRLEGAFVEPDPVPPPVIPVPDITARQIRLWLLSQGRSLPDVETAIAGLPEQQRAPALVEWEFSTTFQRSNPLVAGIGAALGFSPTEIDDGFRAAALI